jgi:hypothetical protein
VHPFRCAAFLIGFHAPVLFRPFSFPVLLETNKSSA